MPPTNTPIPTLNPNAIVNEDFEDEIASGIMIGEGLGNWQIVSDSTGNKVLKVDNIGGLQWPAIAIGPSNLTDFKIDYRAKLTSFDLSKDTGSGVIGLSFRLGDSGGYVFAFHPYFKRAMLSFMGADGVWKPLDGGYATVAFKKDVWYSVQIEVQGSTIKAYLNNSLLFTVKDDKFKEGGVSMGVGPNTSAELDDIQIAIADGK